jgi:hypothetical protein
MIGGWVRWAELDNMMFWDGDGMLIIGGHHIHMMTQG